MPKAEKRNISGGVRKVFRWIGNLLVPWQWTEGTITDFLNAETEQDRRELTNLFVTTTLTNYNTIGVTVSNTVLLINDTALTTHADSLLSSPVSSLVRSHGITSSKRIGQSRRCGIPV